MSRIHRIHRIRRLVRVLAGLAGTLLALSADVPAAFATPLSLPDPGGGPGTPVPARTPIWLGPPPDRLSQFAPGPVQLARPQPHTAVSAHLHALVTGGMPGWQITLIALGAALAAATLAVLLDRAVTVRRRVSPPTA